MKELYDINLKNMDKFKTLYSKQIDLQLDMIKTIRFFSNKNIIVQAGSISAECIGDVCYITKIMHNGDRVLFLKVKETGTYEITEYLNDTFIKANESEKSKHKFISNLITHAVSMLFFIYICNTKLRFNNLNERQPKDFKVIKSKFYKTVVIKKCDVEFKVYNSEEEMLTIIHEEGKVNLFNNETKILKTIPSSMYPLSSTNNIKVFTHNNTEELPNDVINDMLTGNIFRTGYCYTNTDTILEILNKSNNLKDRVKFYEGWLYRYGQMTHHGWTVIDDKYVIDPSIFRIEVEEEIIDKKNIKEGKVSIIGNGNKMVVKMRKIMNDTKIPFKEKYGYGNVLSPYDVYVGVEANSTIARNVYRDLIRKYPNHPDYLNVDKKTGLNETQKKIYSE